MSVTSLFSKTGIDKMDFDAVIAVSVADLSCDVCGETIYRISGLYRKMMAAYSTNTTCWCEEIIEASIQHAVCCSFVCVM